MITLVGMNHRSAPLDVRERACFPDDGLEAALHRLKGAAGVEEAMILATCNRVEILTRGVADAPAAASAVREFLAAERGLDAELLERHVYVHEGLSAARHVFAVACGLDSMILGEPQIQGQVKRAYETARGLGATGPVLDRLLQHALAAARRTRRATGISRHAVSIAYAAAKLARSLFDELTGRHVLILGAGKMTELAARHLVSQGASRLSIVNRTYARADTLAERLGGVALPWDDLPGALERVDIVLTGTAAVAPVLTRETVRRALPARRGAPLLIVDIAVPRDVEPETNALEGVYLYDVDDLQDIVDEGLGERRRAAEEARRLLEIEVVAFDRWRQAADLAPTIAALRGRLHAMGRDELARFSRRLASLDDAQRATVEEVARALVQKILHRPTVALKAAADRGEATRFAALYREIFGLDPDTPDEEASGPRRLIRGGKDD
jgi:glutamyl-tRNA reductase